MKVMPIFMAFRGFITKTFCLFRMICEISDEGIESYFGTTHTAMDRNQVLLKSEGGKWRLNRTQMFVPPDTTRAALH